MKGSTGRSALPFPILLPPHTIPVLLLSSANTVTSHPRIVKPPSLYSLAQPPLRQNLLQNLDRLLTPLILLIPTPQQPGRSESSHSRSIGREGRGRCDFGAGVGNGGELGGDERDGGDTGGGGVEGGTEEGGGEFAAEHVGYK